FVAEFLCQQITLPSSGRTAVPIIIYRRHRVVRFGQALRPKHLLCDRITDEVFDELHVIGAIGIDPWLTVTARMTQVGPRGDIASINRRILIQTSGSRTTAAAESLRATVPSACQATATAIRCAQRQADEDRDILVRISAVNELDPAIGGIRWARGHGC